MKIMKVQRAITEEYDEKDARKGLESHQNGQGYKNLNGEEIINAITEVEPSDNNT